MNKNQKAEICTKHNEGIIIRSFWESTMGINPVRENVTRLANKVRLLPEYDVKFPWL